MSNQEENQVIEDDKSVTKIYQMKKKKLLQVDKPNSIIITG